MVSSLKPPPLPMVTYGSIRERRRLTASELAAMRWARSRGAVFEVGNPSAEHWYLPMGVAVVRTMGGAVDPLTSYVVVESDAAYNRAALTAGLAYRVGPRPIRSWVRAGVRGPNEAEMLAGIYGLQAALHLGVHRVCLRTDNLCLAYHVIGKWSPHRDYIHSATATLTRLRDRFSGFAVAHVRTSEIRALDTASKRTLRTFLDASRSP